MPRGHIFGDLFRLSLLSTDFSLYSAMHAMTERLEQCEGPILDLASTLFFGGERSGSEELPEDSSSSVVASLSLGRMGSLPLFCLIEGARWLLPRGFSPRSSSKRARRLSFSCYRRSAWPHNSTICMACSSCFVSISRHQRRKWSSRG